MAKKKKSRRRKKLEEMLKMLDERLVRGEISEPTYKELKAKYSAGLEEIAEKPAAPKIAVAEKPTAPAPAVEKPPEKPAPKPEKTPWGKCPVCGGEWPPGLDECKGCKATALAAHSIHKNRSLLVLGPRGKRARGFVHVEYGARRIAFLIDWLPISEFSDGATLIKSYKDGTNDCARFKLKTREWDVHFHKGITNPEKILGFFTRPSERPAEVVPSKPAEKANICPNCGAKLEPGAKFCPNCGRKVEPSRA